jgi:hypothetical protein
MDAPELVADPAAPTPMEALPAAVFTAADAGKSHLRLPLQRPAMCIAGRFACHTNQFIGTNEEERMTLSPEQWTWLAEDAGLEEPV